MSAPIIETRFTLTLCDPYRRYGRAEVLALLNDAARMGIPLDEDSPLNGLTVDELARLVLHPS